MEMLCATGAYRHHGIIPLFEAWTTFHAVARNVMEKASLSGFQWDLDALVSIRKLRSTQNNNCSIINYVRASHIMQRVSQWTLNVQ